jgi:hypothetical protein
MPTQQMAVALQIIDTLENLASTCLRVADLLEQARQEAVSWV